MKIKALIVLGGICLLAGCASDPKQQVNVSYMATDKPPAEAANPDAQNQLAEAATSVGGSLQELSAIQQATHPQAKATPFDPQALGMTQPTSLDWYGPVEPLLQQIAAASGYQVNTLGKQPATPILVSISVKDQPLALILQNAAYQVQNQADIQVDPKRKVIELRYHNT